MQENALTTTDATEQLKTSLCNFSNPPILLLGAGFSIGAQNGLGEPMMTGAALAKNLYQQVFSVHKDKIMGLSKDEEEEVCRAAENKQLKTVCSSLYDFGLLEERDAYLQAHFSGCCWNSKAMLLEEFASYPWKYIFTLNIDDLVEQVYKKSHRPLLVWMPGMQEYDLSAKETVLVKLHGSVTSEKVSVVLSEQEYKEFTASRSYILEHFAQEYMRHDLIVVGTQFQEDDLHIALEEMLLKNCISKQHHVFFLSPHSYSRKIRNFMQKYGNVYWIPWKNTDFFALLKEIMVQKQQETGLVQLNCCSSWDVSSWDFHAWREDPRYDLYYGHSPTMKDFQANLDIGRRVLDHEGRETNHWIVTDFMDSIRDSKKWLVAVIHGRPYVGKSCLALRLLTECSLTGWHAFYARNLDEYSLRDIQEFLKQRNEGRYVFCIENAAPFFYLLAQMIKEAQEDGKQVVFILTSEERAYDTKKHVFFQLGNAWKNYAVSEHVDRYSAGDIYRKLKETMHLGKLQSEETTPKKIKNKIRLIDDWINVLWVAHEGHYFSEHAGFWYRKCKENEADQELLLFDFLGIATMLGCLGISASRLPHIADALNIRKFRYDIFQSHFNEFFREENGCVSVRCVRMLSELILAHVSPAQKMQIVELLIRELSRHLQERGDGQGHTQATFWFESVAKEKNLEELIRIPLEDILRVYHRVENACRHLSFYWIQRSIVHRKLHHFEEAANAIQNAEGVRGYRTYQIIHVDAHNEMERGRYLLDRQPEEGKQFFEEGITMIKYLIDNKEKYEAAFFFAAHTYLVESMKYYEQIGTHPPATEWLYMKNVMQDLEDEADWNDRYFRDLKHRFEQYQKSIEEADVLEEGK